MPDIFDQLLAEGNPAAPGSIPAEPAQPFHNAGPTGDVNIFDQLLAQPGASQSAPTGWEDESWWGKHGKTVEKAAAAGLAVIGGPLALRGVSKLATKTGALGETAARGTKAIQSIFAPATVDDPAKHAAGLIREDFGQAAREVAKVESRLAPEWRRIGNATDIDKLQFINYVEGRSKGVALARPELQGLADELRTAYSDVHKKLGTLNATQKTGFINDYYRHHWVVDDAHKAAFSKSGVSGFTKERTIPTIEAGMARGLKPKTLDPIQTTLEYVENARRFIASNSVLERAKQTGHVFTKSIGSKRPFPETYDKWVPLEGSLAQKGVNRLYAPEGFARVYNNWVLPGFTGAAGDVVNAARRTSNAITGLELGLSGFHATTMVNEAIVNDVAKAIQQAAGGRIGDSLKSLAMAPTAPVRLYKHGRQIEKIYLGTERGTKDMREITKLLTQAGGRGAGNRHAADYEYTAMGSFIQAWKRGALRAQQVARFQNVKEAPVLGTIKGVSSLIGQTIQTVAEPLFKYYIPRLKNGAFYDTMASWIKSNPTASRDMKLKAAREIWDSIDNRFGEMVHDNIFWKQHMKQTAMLGMRSYSWTMGAIREIGGGAKDMTMHKFTPRAAYVIALPVVYGTVGAVYQYLKTGEPPTDTHDLLAPKTGGTDPATGLPERMIMPGFIKDVIGWTDHPTDEFIAKLSTGVTIPINIARNRDWRGAPIAPPSDPSAPYEKNAPGWLKAYFDYVGQAMVPISIRDMAKGPKEGTNLNQFEQILGMRTGGRDKVDPEGAKQLKYYFGSRDWQKKLQFDERQKSLHQGYGGVE